MVGPQRFRCSELLNGESRVGVTYHGIDCCDNCGQLLEQGQWLCGLCRACEQAQKMPKRSVEILEPTKGLVS